MSEDNPSYDELKQKLAEAETALAQLRADRGPVQSGASESRHPSEPERRYQDLFENMNAGFVLFEAVLDDKDTPVDLVILTVNKGFEKTTGLTREVVIGKRLTHVLPGIENDPADWIGRYGQIAISGDAQQFEQDSELLGYSYAVNAYQAAPNQCAVTFIDITERRQAEEALRISEELFANLFHVGPAALTITRIADGTFIEANESFCDLFEYKREEVIGRTSLELNIITKEQRKVLIERQLATGGLRQAELVSRARSGKIINLLFSSSEIELKGERCHVTTMIDITERKQAEAERAMLQEQLLQSQKMESIGRLAGGVAHDFNNLLLPIMGYVELAMVDIPPDHEIYPNLLLIREAAERAAGLTRQILAFSRKQALQVRVLNLNTIVEDFEKMTQRLVEEDIELQIFLEPALGRIKADQGQIEQVLLNLIVNARDAMPSGGKLSIETGNVYLDETYVKRYADAQPPGQYVMLAISDTGHGIDPEIKKHIFEPFFTTKGLSKGTGLGLATVHGIVKQHSGNIWVYSEPGKGTTFKIYLPLVEEGIQAPKEPPSSLADVHGTETIIVVEDDKMVRELICKTLTTYGYRIIEAAHGDDAYKFACQEKAPPDLLLTDVIMPGINGRKLYEKVAGIYPDIKVIYMSGYTDNVIVHHGILDPDINYLQKPFSIRTLAEKIRMVLG